MIMKRPNETAPSVHHFLFSGVISRALTRTSWFVSRSFAKLVVTRLAAANRPGQGRRREIILGDDVRLDAHRRSAPARERRPPRTPARLCGLQGASRPLGRGSRPLLAGGRRRPRHRVLAAVEPRARRVARARVGALVRRRPDQRGPRVRASLGRQRARRRRGGGLAGGGRNAALALVARA